MCFSLEFITDLTIQFSVGTNKAKYKMTLVCQLIHIKCGQCICVCVYVSTPCLVQGCQTLWSVAWTVMAGYETAFGANDKDDDDDVVGRSGVVWCGAVLMVKVVWLHFQKALKCKCTPLACM